MAPSASGSTARSSALTAPATSRPRRSASHPRRCAAGADNVVAVLVQSSSHDEDGVYGNPPSDSQKSPRGLMGATLAGGTETVSWRLQGNEGGEQLQDPTRGPLNATGLYGTNHGWDLPGYPDGDWRRRVAARRLDTAAACPRGSAGIGPPSGCRSPSELQPGRGAARQSAERLHTPTPGRSSSSTAGCSASTTTSRDPNTSSTSLPGSSNDRGVNTLAIAEWALSPSGGGLGTVKTRVASATRPAACRSRQCPARPTRPRYTVSRPRDSRRSRRPPPASLPSRGSRSRSPPRSLTRPIRRCETQR